MEREGKGKPCPEPYSDDIEWGERKACFRLGGGKISTCVKTRELRNGLIVRCCYKLGYKFGFRPLASTSLEKIDHVPVYSMTPRQRFPNLIFFIPENVQATTR
jgi:hypothetical protein